MSDDTTSELARYMADGQADVCRMLRRMIAMDPGLQHEVRPVLARAEAIRRTLERAATNDSPSIRVEPGAFTVESDAVVDTQTDTPTAQPQPSGSTAIPPAPTEARRRGRKPRQQ